MTLSHNSLASNLARHLLNADRMVWEDLPAGKRGSVRPDVYTIEKSFANPNPISYEVKVSVPDFRADVTCAKWKHYLDFSHGVVFAVPKDLITKKDLPTGCGLITFNGKFWNTVKRPTLHPTRLDDELLMKLLIGSQQRQTQPELIQCRSFDDYQHHQTLRKKFGKDIGAKLSFINEYPDMKKDLIKMRRSFAKLFDIELDHWCFERQVAWHIEKLEIMAQEHSRKQAIAKELGQMQQRINIGLQRIIDDYTK